MQLVPGKQWEGCEQIYGGWGNKNCVNCVDVCVSVLQVEFLHHYSCQHETGDQGETDWLWGVAGNIMKFLIA